MKERIELGWKVRDTVTNFEGIATARCEYLNGCVQVQVHPTIDEKGDIRKAFWIDESQLEKIGEGLLAKKLGSGGGFREHPDD